VIENFDEALKEEAKLLIGSEGGSCCLRVEGRGTFKVSPTLKEAFAKEFEAGKKKFIIDLEACSGMDSTFMGALAGMGMRLKKLEEARLLVIGASPKNQESLEELGLHYLLEIIPLGSSSEDDVATKEQGFSEVVKSCNPSDEGHILESHENLIEIYVENKARFQTVLEVLGSQKIMKDADSQT
jgi:anti-sigma B factor antagonist